MLNIRESNITIFSKYIKHLDISSERFEACPYFVAVLDAKGY